MHPQIILGTALSTGALTDNNTPAGRALLALAESDHAKAQAFASKARTPRERAELSLLMDQNISFANAREAACKFGGVGVTPALAEAQLIAMYGA